MTILPPAGPARRLALAQLANSVGDGAFFVTFALFFTRIVGVPATQFGIGVSLGWVAGLLAGVPLGHLADRRGLRGTAVVLASATALSVVALIAVGMLAGQAMPLFVVAMCAYACSQAGLHAARQALLARLVEPGQRTRTRAYLQSTANAGLAFGAALGGVALWRDTEAAYVTVLGVDAVAFAFAAVVLHRLPVVAGAARVHGTAAVLRDRPYAVIALLHAVLLLNMPLLSWVLPLWIAERTAAPRGMVAAVLVLNTLGVALLQVRVARVVRDVATGARAGLLLAVACVVFAASGAGSSPWLAVLCLVTAASFQVAGEMLQSAGGWQLSFDLSPPDRHGQYQGLFGSGIALARIVGPALLTTLVVAWGAPGWFVLGGIFALAAALMVPAARWAERSTVHAPWRSTSAAGRA